MEGRSGSSPDTLRKCDRPVAHEESAAAAAEPEEGVAETAEGDVDMVTGEDPDLT